MDCLCSALPTSTHPLLACFSSTQSAPYTALALTLTPIPFCPACVAPPACPQAHQRRGESDLVAHWMYVLLALDTRAPEWDHMLLGSPLSR